MSSKLPPYILQELPDITETVTYPIKNVHRIKYTCFDISKSLIAFGATSGGIYVFNRWPCEFVQLIPSKDGPITRLAISADEKYVGFANGKGIVTVIECDGALSGGNTSAASKEHQGNEVTAMVWSRNILFAGDDIGRVSVLQLQNFIAKTMFHTSSQVIMNLDSRICQLDAKECMLLVSTLTRCYICNTAREQYRQIGQKLRDGEFGACFVNKEKPVENGTLEKTSQDFTEVKQYNIVDDDVAFTVGEEFANTLIYCARPSSRLWEATIDGMVRRTHQFKQTLAKQPMKPITIDSYDNDEFSIDDTISETKEQSVNFSKIYTINSAIFSFSKNALYFLNIQDVDNTVWFSYKEVVDCKIYNDILYVWLANGSLIHLKFMKIDKFLLKCYIDEKYVICAKFCSLYSEYLLSNSVSPKLHILAGLKDKLQMNGISDSLDSIIVKFESLKSSEATQMKSGIYVVDNTYQTQSALDEKDNRHDDHMFSNISPEALQAIKGLSVTVTDKLNSSKKMLKEKWEDFEGRMKHLSIDKQSHDIQDKNVQEKENAKWIARDDYNLNEDTPILVNNDIIYKESSQKAIEIDNNSVEKETCMTLYQYSRLSLVGKETDMSNLTSIIESYACDINQIHNLMLSLEQYCLSIGAVDEAKYVPNNIFLSYLNASQNPEILDIIINDEELYKYFVDSCILVNVKRQKIANLGCECGFPLPYVRTSQMPVFPELIDQFIERQWTSQSKEQCYEVCKRMPYLWRKILYLRRNEDLLNVLRILLQMLDESLLHSFLPQFTLDSWERAVQLYATLHANICLNCNKKFDNISVKDMLSWDDLGLLIIKSVGGRNAIKVMEKYANLIEMGAVTIKFYHACLLTTLYEKYDVTIAIPLADTVYCSYDFKDPKKEICNLLRGASHGDIKNTALPITIAATSPHWGLNEVYERLILKTKQDDQKEILLLDILNILLNINNGVLDCSLCGLPLQNEFLIQDGGLWVFKCGHTFHGACLDLNHIKLCPSCSLK
ncbi:BLOC-2 complex member HPS5 homolog [Epargyreus clarus]|uniref:BLOC-2 complex member HPS5 homolog n=1 Tax=Epargyreus clarus TaxID=520877 RepID=UPI003C2B4168